MKILVTGAKGFIGKNVVYALKNRGYEDVFAADTDTAESQLASEAARCDAVIHLAGINRPKDDSEFVSGNIGFTGEILKMLAKNPHKPVFILSSSIQAELDNPYGASKKGAEDEVFSYAETGGLRAYVFRLPNVFGKWCNPNYNSVVATFCGNIASGKPIQVNGEDTPLRLVYIDDVVDAFIAAVDGRAKKEGKFCVVEPVYTLTLGRLASLIRSFRRSREDLSVPDMSDGLTEKANCDTRGSFTEFIRTAERGQFSVNVAKPGITKGNHWHDTKNEKFLVVSGRAVIRFRRIFEDKIYEYCVSGDEPRVIDIPVGYTHSITNIGDSDLVTLMWANEPFDPDEPDTWYLEV